MGIEIHHVDTATAPEGVLIELADYYGLVDAEEMPGDPPTPVARRLADWRYIPSHVAVHYWVLRESGDIVGVAEADYDLEQNLENGFGRVHIHPEKRGLGFARNLATPMFDQLERSGRGRFATWANQDSASEPLFDRLGLKRVYGDKRSRLTIADLDMDLMRSWVDSAVDRAGDYVLQYHPIPIEDEMIEEFCELQAIMNTAPREDMEMEDEVLTPQMWRETEESLIKRQCQLQNLIAVHEPTGALAGFTQIKTQDLQPDLAWQWNTGVHPDHRNKGLGRWLKAEMIMTLVEEYPAVARIDTYNAGSNEPMLNINVAMGFEPVQVASVWQGPLATVRERSGA